LLRFVTAKVIKVGYLAQLRNIDPGYARAIYDLLLEAAKSGEEGFEIVDVQHKAKGAELAGKEAKFGPSRAEERLVGFSPEMGVYNV
jgi:catalase